MFKQQSFIAGIVAGCLGCLSCFYLFGFDFISSMHRTAHPPVQASLLHPSEHRSLLLQYVQEYKQTQGEEAIRRPLVAASVDRVQHGPAVAPSTDTNTAPPIAPQPVHEQGITSNAPPALYHSNLTGPHCGRISDLLVRLRYSHDADVTQPAEIFTSGTARLHPDYDTFVDVGAFDGKDYAIPAFKLGYKVLSFEINSKNLKQVQDNLLRAGMRHGTDFTRVQIKLDTVSGLPYVNATQLTKRPHVYVFAAGAGAANGWARVHGEGVYARIQVDTSAAGLRSPGPVPGSGSGSGSGKTQSNNHLSRSGKEGDTPVLAIDGLLQASDRIHTLKIDAQGFDPLVVSGALKTLTGPDLGRVYNLRLELSPKLSADVGLDAKHMLHTLYAAGWVCADMNTHPATSSPSRGAYIREGIPTCIGDYVDFLRSKDDEDDLGDGIMSLATTLAVGQFANPTSQFGVLGEEGVLEITPGETSSDFLLRLLGACRVIRVPRALPNNHMLERTLHIVTVAGVRTMNQPPLKCRVNPNLFTS